jgi:hypothetical protein
MPATPRDLLKPRQQRLSEVLTSAQLQAGQANAQQIVWGLKCEAETKKCKVLAGEYLKDGVSEPVAFVEKTGVSFPAGCTTAAGVTLLVLVEITVGTTTVTLTPGAATAGTPILPALTAGRIAVAQILVPESWTATSSEANLCTYTAIKYSAGNASPTSGF